MTLKKDYLRYGPLTSTQKTMYAISQNERAAAKMNLSYSLLVEGYFQPEKFELALSLLIEKYEALRTRYEPNEAAWTPDIEVVNCASLEEFEKRRICQTIFQQEQGHNFDLKDSQQIRVKLAELGANKWMAFITLNHISADAWSLKLLCKDWSDFYNYALNENGESATKLLNKQSIQTIDVAEAEARKLADSEMEHLIEDYQMTLAELSSDFAELQYDFQRYPVPYLRDSRIVSAVPESVAASLEKLKTQYAISDFAIFLAGFVLAVARWQDSDAVAVGSLAANRNLPGASKVLGALYNSAYYLYSNFSHLNVRAFLQKTEEICYNVHKFQSLPFVEVAKVFTEKTGRHADLLSQIMIYMDEFPMDGLVLKGCDVNGYHFDPAISETVQNSKKEPEGQVGATEIHGDNRVTRLATASNAVLSLFIRRGKHKQSVSFFYKTDLISDITAAKLLEMTFNNIIQLEEDPQEQVTDLL